MNQIQRELSWWSKEVWISCCDQCWLTFIILSEGGWLVSGSGSKSKSSIVRDIENIQRILCIEKPTQMQRKMSYLSPEPQLSSRTPSMKTKENHSEGSKDKRWMTEHSRRSHPLNAYQPLPHLTTWVSQLLDFLHGFTNKYRKPLLLYNDYERTFEQAFCGPVNDESIKN